jgi:hypothetical protein
VHEVLLPGTRLGTLGSSPSTEETGGGRCLQERRLVAMGKKIEITFGGEVDDLLD